MIPDGRVAVITTARHRRTHLARQREALARHGPDVAHVVVDMGGDTIDEDELTIVVDAQVPDGAPLPLSACRNLGAETAMQRCSADVLVFLDVDCIPTRDFARSYARRATDDHGIWSGPVGYLPPSDGIEDWTPDALRSIARFHDGRPAPGQPPQPAPSPDMFWSLSFACSSGTWARLGGFDEAYVGYGGEDTDFGHTADRRGVPLWFDGAPIAFHQHHEVESPPRRHLDDIVRNATTFHRKWGAWPMEGWLRQFCDDGLIDWDPDGDRLRRRIDTTHP